MVAQTCNPRTQEAKADHPGLHGKFKASLRYTNGSCLKKKKKRRKETSLIYCNADQW
jgi:hypothetical protein